jgi:hypothetical protein
MVAVGIVLAAAAAGWVLAPLRCSTRSFALTPDATADRAPRTLVVGDGAIASPEASAPPRGTGQDTGGRG